MRWRRVGASWVALPFEPLLVVDDEEEEADWEIWREFYEFAVNHELRIWEEIHHIVGGICTSHPRARRDLKNGVIHLDWACSENDACLVRKLSKTFGAKTFILKYQPVLQANRNQSS